MGITILDCSAYVGIMAVGAATLNMLLGTLMAFRYSPVRNWPHRRINYFQLHKASGYIALGTAILHPMILLFNPRPLFRFVDLIYPLHSPSQPLENTVGALALYLIAFVVVTSYFRIRLGRRMWKAFHFSIYLAAAALFFHGLRTDPDLKNAPIEWLDGGKIFVESCLVLILGASLARYWHSRTRPRLAVFSSQQSVGGRAAD